MDEMLLVHEAPEGSETPSRHDEINVFVAAFVTTLMLETPALINDGELGPYPALVLCVCTGYLIAPRVWPHDPPKLLLWAIFGLKFQLLTMWRWTGIACPDIMQPWYCTGSSTDRWSMLYLTSPGNAWATLLVWGVVTALYVCAVPVTAYHRYIWRGLDAGFWFMYFFASGLPSVYVEGTAGLAILALAGLTGCTTAWYFKWWSARQWLFLTAVLVMFLLRLTAFDGHIHHAEWPLWLIVLTVGPKYGAIVAGFLFGMAAQELSGSGIFVIAS